MLRNSECEIGGGLHKALAPQEKVLPEVLLPHDIVSGKFLGGSLEEHFSFKEQVSAVRNGERFVHVVVGNENTYVLSP